MKELLISVLLLVSMGMYAQTDSVVYARDAEGHELKTIPINFDKFIYSFRLSPDGNTIAMKQCAVSKKGRLARKGCLNVYSLTENKTLMLQEIPYMAVWNYLTDSYFLYQMGTITRCYSLSNIDVPIWEERIDPTVIYDSHDLIMGYKTLQSTKFRALNLSTGKELWKQDIPFTKNYGWHESVWINDTLMAVANNSFCLLNPNTGSLHTIKAHTGHTDKGAIIMQMLGGVAMGLATGALTGVATYYVPYVSQNVVAHTCSNIVNCKDNLFFSDRNSIMCLATNGDTLWTHKFNGSIASSAYLQVHDDKICMVNYGYGLKGGVVRDACGKAFLSFFDIKTGEMLNNKLWDEVNNGRIMRTISDTIYLFNDKQDKFIPFVPTSDQVVVETGNKKLMVLDNSFDIIDELSSTNVYNVLVRCGKISLVSLANDNKSLWLIYNDGTPIMHIVLPVQCIDLRDDKLVMASGKSLIVQDLKKYQ